MSWDIFVFASEVPPPPVDEMPESWSWQPLGSQDEVRDKINKCIPNIDWSDPSWGVFDGNGFSYEFSVGKTDPCDSIAVHVRGGGDAVALLLRLGDATGWYLLDTSQPEWIHHCSDPNSGWVRFQAFRDQVIAKSHEPPDC
ncbi:MAG: hypothetical protein CMJ58_17140 [Planctomycetaceae bacterium]|nr:hypothetical protein [Planctomycetaceae bacterium]